MRTVHTTFRPDVPLEVDDAEYTDLSRFGVLLPPREALDADEPAPEPEPEPVVPPTVPAEPEEHPA